MRFGRNIHQHQIPEWKEAYIAYNELKRRFKFSLKLATEQGQEPELSAFEHVLRREMANIETFYVEHLNTINHKKIHCFNHYGLTPESLRSWDHSSWTQHDLDDILATSLEQWLSFKKLYWYAKVNRDCIHSLRRKFEKNSCTVPTYMNDCSHRFMNESYSLEHLDRCITLAQLQPTALQPASVSLFLKSSCEGLSLDINFSQAIYSAFLEDNVSEMEHLLVARAFDGSLSETQLRSLRLSLLQTAIDVSAKECIQSLVTKVERLQYCASSKLTDYLHRLVISIGRHVSFRDNGQLELGLSESADRMSLLKFVLDQLQKEQRQDILAKDDTGRTPLHYASQYGSVKTCKIILERIQIWNLLDKHTNASIFWDAGGHTPLAIGVIEGHAGIVRELLDFQELSGIFFNGTEVSNPGENTIGDLLAIAIMSKFDEIVRLLLATRNLDINYRNRHGESILFVASRIGRQDYVKMIIESRFGEVLDLNIPESAYGRTPLIAACVGDHLSVAKILLDVGCDENVQDLFGWTAKDHVAYRGYWQIAALLQEPSSNDFRRTSKRRLCKTNALPPCRAGESRIFVNLGTLNTRNPKDAVNLEPLLSNFPYNPYPETTFQVQIQAKNATGQTTIVELPSLRDLTNYPCCFTTNDPEKVMVVFDIYKAEQSSHLEVEHVGSAVALLSSLKDCLGPSRESLIRDYTLPILAKSSLKMIGTVTFDFLIVRPFPDPRVLSISPQEMIWKSSGTTPIVGHRGLGQNSPAYKRLQMGENTINSFLATASLGVSYIECDIQLTRDHVPVVYHDFLMSENGADLAPQHLSLDQFKFIGEMQKPRISELLRSETNPSTNKQRGRSYSLNIPDDCRTEDLLSRMKLTHHFKMKGFKGNIRGEHIHGPFTTLEELLQAMPENVGIDIELKYPMLWEAEDWKMDLYGIELNLFVDTILDKIYSLAGNRAIIFTSFSPELCILLSHKQNTYQVMFLNESNLFPTGDVRASNLQEAVRFARNWNLPGVVMSSEPFVLSPKLIQYVKDVDLVCVSFGELNNDPKNAKIQADAGLDAIIVDHVNLIVNALQKAPLL